MTHPTESELRQELERLTKERQEIEDYYFSDSHQSRELAERMITINRRIMEIQSQLNRQ